jgi:hypothetical protein
MRPWIALAIALTACGSDDCEAPPRCAPDVTVACRALRTPATVAGPANACAEHPATGDAPREGFPVGTTEVHFRSDTGMCTTRVTVTDTAAPTLDCAGLPPAFVTVRGAAATVPLPQATDGCSANVTVTAAPTTLTAAGSVTFTAADAAGNRASCTATVQVQTGLIATGLRVAHAEIVDDHTTATLVWDHTADDGATGYRVERATSATGPWATAGETAPDAPRYVEEALPSGRVYYRVVTVVGGRDAGATEAVRALAVAASSYDLGVQPIPNFVLPANPAARTPEARGAPLHGVVRHPADLSGGPYPLALLLHGNHGNCRRSSYDFSGSNPALDDACVTTNTGACPGGARPSPNAEGLAALAETLAAHGYVVASVDANTVNCRDLQRGSRPDGFIGQRAQMLVEHLRRWRSFASAEGAEPYAQAFSGHVDLGRVALFGHSRGAEAVAAVPAALAGATDVDGIAVASVFALAPTNFDNPQPGAVPFATLVPMCDGDVFTYNGVQLYDRTLRHEGDAAPAAQLFFAHANHNYFNTEWRFDDNAFGITSCTSGEVTDPDALRRSLEVMVSAWFDGTVPDGAALEPWLRASGDVPPGVVLHSDIGFPFDLRRSYEGGRVARIDDFADADAARNLLGGAWSTTGAFTPATPVACTGVSSPACDRTYTVNVPPAPIRFGWPHHNPFGPTPARAALALDWTGDAVLTSALGDAYDASAYRALSLRLASRVNTLTGAQTTPNDLEVRLVDADGRRASARVSEVVTVPHLYRSQYGRAVLQTARFTLAGMAARATPPLDLRRLRAVEIATSPMPRGSLLVTDVAFSE